MIKQFTSDKPSVAPRSEPVIIPRAEHTITRNAISEHALKVLYRLHNAGYSAFLVGGCVRDLLLGWQPKDFDIATDANPEEVRRLFRNSRIIGRRFRLVHVVFGQEMIEVATFRTSHENASSQQAHKSDHGMIMRDNVYGTIEDDVWRRDFTINALYYNIANFSIVDYTTGMEDLKSRTVRMIGNPEERFREDPVRLLRAVRFLAKLQLNINPETEEPITRLSNLLENVSTARLLQEVLKIFQEGALSKTVELLQKYHLFTQLFPQTAAVMQHDQTKKLLEIALKNTDARIKEGKSVSPAFIFAIFLWQPIVEKTLHFEANGLPATVSIEKAISHVLQAQTERLAVPKRIMIAVREICLLQYRFAHRSGKRPFRLLDHPRFRAAYDLLILRAESGEPIGELRTWWQEFHDSGSDKRMIMLRKLTRGPKKT